MPARSYINNPKKQTINKFNNHKFVDDPSFQIVNRPRNKEKLTQSVSQVTSGRVSDQRVGPCQSDVHKANRVELELPLSNKEMPLSDKGAPQSEISKNQLEQQVNGSEVAVYVAARNPAAAKKAPSLHEQPQHRNTVSINGSISGDVSPMITANPRDVSRGKESFLSPYVNMGNRASNNGAYVTPNRQTEFSTRLYASGGEALALHGGDADLNSILRLNQSNNAGGSYFQQAYQDLNAAGLSSGVALATSKPVGAPSMLQRQQQNLPSHPKSSGHKKKRGITGATGAAGSIMAANITNMGYHYPVVSSNDFAAGGGYSEGNHLRMAEKSFKE